MALEFRDVFLSQELAAKLASKHGVEVEEVREALGSHDLQVRWRTNHEGTAQLLCRGRTDAGRRLNIVLYPESSASSGRWRLATAYPDPRG